MRFTLARSYKMDAMRAAVGDGKDGARSELTLDGQAPELGLCDVDVGIVIAQFHRSKGGCGAGRPRGPKELLVTT